MSEPVLIVEYDPLWADRFEEERSNLVRALDPLCLQVEHIGSTSVPGLDAKPIIDLMVIVESVEDALRTITPLVDLGYECRGEFGVTGRIFFRKGNPRSHHVHVYARESSEIERHLMFRDFLRANPDVAAEYAALKRELAAKHRDERAAYAQAKDPFITSIEVRARLEWNKT